MPRTNKITERVFSGLEKTRDRNGAHERFLALDGELGLQETKGLIAWKKRYADLAENFVDDLRDLALMEEIIIQMRAKQVIKSEIRLSLSRNYVYARSLFYRRGNQINDIRVVVGKTEEFGTSDFALLNIRLETDPAFLVLCVSKLETAMDLEIERTIVELNKVYANG
jgi:hypothetical protein